MRDDQAARSSRVVPCRINRLNIDRVLGFGRQCYGLFPNTLGIGGGGGHQFALHKNLQLGIGFSRARKFHIGRIGYGI